MNIENLSAQPETRMKDIKLSASSESRRGSTQRSWSLAEHVGDERLALQLAKEMVEREVPEEQVLPMPDIVPLVPVAIEEEKAVAEEEPEEVKPAKKSSNRSKVACQLVSIVLEQKLAEVELELQVPGPLCRNPHHVTRPSPINTRCPSDCAQPLRTQESVAWEYHQNPSCSFNIRLNPIVEATRPVNHRPSDTVPPSVGPATTLPPPLITTTTTTNPSPSGIAKVRAAAPSRPSFFLFQKSHPRASWPPAACCSLSSG